MMQRLKVTTAAKLFGTAFMTLLAPLVALPGVVTAAPSAEKVSQLGKDLTPLGAIRAGSSDGTIPEWTGGITTPPAGYRPGMHHLDPYAGDKPRFRVTAKNLSSYESLLSPGQVALLRRYPETWYLEVYPTRRSASYPQRIYDAAMDNAKNARLTEDGNGVVGASISIPFPVPENGLHAIWNHLLRYRGDTTQRDVGQVSPTADGSYTMVRITDETFWAYMQPGATVDSINNRLAYFLQTVTAPPRLAGTILLVHETLNQRAEPRNAWTYNPGQRRVRRAPNVAYDNPGTASDSQRTSDQLDMFNGAPDRYDWKLIGRKELLVPYNSYKVHSEKIAVDDLVKPGHLNPELLRYEVHRVWHVEATLKPGTSHIYKRRSFYFDEDSWQALVVDQYDARDQVWRVSEAHPINYYDVPLLWDTLQVHHDLQNGRYLAFGINNQFPIEKFNAPMDLASFSPDALRREGRR